MLSCGTDHEIIEPPDLHRTSSLDCVSNRALAADSWSATAGVRQLVTTAGCGEVSPSSSSGLDWLTVAAADWPGLTGAAAVPGGAGLDRGGERCAVWTGWTGRARDLSLVTTAITTTARHCVLPGSSHHTNSLGARLVCVISPPPTTVKINREKDTGLSWPLLTTNTLY